MCEECLGLKLTVADVGGVLVDYQCTVGTDCSGFKGHRPSGSVGWIVEPVTHVEAARNAEPWIDCWLFGLFLVVHKRH